MAGMEVQAPFGMSAHFFSYTLELDDLVQGYNILELETKRQEKTAGFTRSVNGVEVRVRYKEFERPAGPRCGASRRDIASPCTAATTGTIGLVWRLGTAWASNPPRSIV